MKPSNKKINLKISPWVSRFYTFFAIMLVPWTIYLAYSLPTKQESIHWDVAWVGLDIAIMILLLVTGLLAAIKSRFVIISLCATASFLIVDAWFDLISARSSVDLDQAVLLAFLIEVPVALMGYYLAYKIINQNVD